MGHRASLRSLPNDDVGAQPPVEPMEPINLEWVAGVIAVAYDEALDRIVVVMDINWMAEQYRGSNWEQVAQNVARFLGDG